MIIAVATSRSLLRRCSDTILMLIKLNIERHLARGKFKGRGAQECSRGRMVSDEGQWVGSILVRGNLGKSKSLLRKHLNLHKI